MLYLNILLSQSYPLLFTITMSSIKFNIHDYNVQQQADNINQELKKLKGMSCFGWCDGILIMLHMLTVFLYTAAMKESKDDAEKQRLTEAVILLEKELAFTNMDIQDDFR